MQTRKVAQPGWNLEFIMFIFTRISGLAFFLFALIGVAIALYLGARTQLDFGTLLRWTFFPNVNHILDSNIPDVDLGWVGAFWTTMQILILFFGGTHGINGLRVVLEDYLSNDNARRITRVLIGIIWIVLLVIAILVVLGS